MGLDVELGIVGQAVPLAAIADTRFRFAGAVERAQRDGRLQNLDLYRTRTMWSAEMPAFLAEVARLLADAADDREREVLEAVRRLAERCRDDPALVLQFVGD